MIDHVILTVSNFERSVAFYNQAFKPLGVAMVSDFKGEDGHPNLKGFGDGKTVFLWLKEGTPTPDGIHVGFIANSHAEVESFYTAAAVAGARTIESPRVFNEYYPGYYAAWVIDPDGYELEIVNKS